MKSKNAVLFIFFISLASCHSNPIEKIQVVFDVDKTNLGKLLDRKVDSQNALTSAFLAKVIENAVIEFKIQGDSIKGLIFLAGESTALNTKIEIRNDSLLIKTENTDAFLLPTDSGLSFRNVKSGMSIQMLKSTRSDFSAETKQILAIQIQKEKEQKEFIQSLGQWRKGNFVDEFGDKTDEGFPYSLVVGRHQNSIVVNSEVYVKTVIEGPGLYFQILDKSMAIKENFPDSEFGRVKIKFPNGDIKAEKVFFYKNTITEAPTDKTPLIYNYITQKEGELKLLIDLSTASSYYSDIYQFSLERNNLNEIQLELGK